MSLSQQPHRALQVFMTGGTGTIGGAIQRMAQSCPDLSLRLLSRTRVIKPGFHDTVFGDLLRPSSLRGALDGCDVLIHAASYLGNDVRLQHATNVVGTATLLREAERSGVRALISFSNTAVYGRSPLTGQSEAELQPDPTSSLSATRLEADRLVQDAGGLVLRTNLVYGDGDRHIVPSLVGLIERLGAVIDGGRQLVSVIRNDELARAVLAIVRRVVDSPLSGVLHAAVPSPLTVGDILNEIESLVGWTAPTTSMSVAEARTRSTELGIPEGQLAMVLQDRWVASDRLWASAGIQPPQGVSFDRAAAGWYRNILASPS